MSNKKFDDVYVGATVVANLMGLHADTVRKRAKAGKIPAIQDAKGRWTFVTAELAKAGLEPFASGYVPQLCGTGVPGAPRKSYEKKLTDVIFVLDRSGSMQGLITAAKQNLQAQINELKAAAGPNDVYRISVINFDDSVQTTLRSLDVTAIGDSSHLYLAPHGSTKLYDAVLEAVKLSESLDTGDKQHAFLISVVTDGQENASNNTLQSVANQVRRTTAMDRYTFVFAGPYGSKNVAIGMGFSLGNATEWEQTYRGTQTLGAVTNTSLNTYARSRSVGMTNSTSFYAAPVTKDASKFAGQLDSKLDDVSSRVRVERVTAGDPIVIRKFCEKKFGSFPKGHIYYPLMKSEKVQDYKKLIVQDKTTGNFYTGNKAKSLLGVPNFQGTVHIRPGALGEFKVFVQSTSENRKLPVGEAVVYLP